MLKIEQITADRAQTLLPDLIDLLQDAVDSGASVNFIAPLSAETAENYWRQVLPDLNDGSRVLLGAFQDEQLAGSVQLALAPQQNAPHRAEVQKLLVHRRFRKQGIGGQLLKEIEQVAQQAGRTLLVLDTCQGSDAERLYRHYGYVEVGVIPKFVYVGAEAMEATVFFYRQL